MDGQISMKIKVVFIGGTPGTSSRHPSVPRNSGWESLAYVIENKKVLVPVKLKRCPKGMVRNKITNECIPRPNKPNKPFKQDIKPTIPIPIAKQNVKMGRCPKGTRRNPKTLLCEPKL
jgi:hypothetical protein